MPLTSSTAPRGRAVFSSIAAARAVIARCEARLDLSRQQVLRAAAVARRVRAYLDAYDRRDDRAAALPLDDDNGIRRRR